MDATAHYRQLAQMGRTAFLASAAPAALLRRRDGGGMTAGFAGGSTGESALGADYDGFSTTGTYDEPIGNRPHPPQVEADPDAELEVLPLVKKPGAQFGDRITIGRTSNNDIVLAHHTVSRLHVYFRLRDGRWWITDAGSKNGTALRDADLTARRETEISDGDPVWIGDIEVLFHVASSLYTRLGGR